MLNIKLRHEFLNTRLAGTAVNFSTNKSGSLSKKPEEFLDITYPSFDLLKTLEAIQPNKERPIVIYGERGQGKSHLLSVVYHFVKSPDVAKKYLKTWANMLNNKDVEKFTIRENCCIIAESLEHNRYRNLWEIVFAQHPNGQWASGKFEQSETHVPSTTIMEELFTKKPAIIILDEFQTWYDGLSDNKSTPHQKRAFNFIQILSQIANHSPELLTLIVSVRNGQSDAAQQINRMNPVKIDFTGEHSKHDRRKLLLHRLFENKQQLNESDIRKELQIHVDEYFRMFNIPQIEHERYWGNFIEQYPFSPLLFQLLDDQVLIAVESQETRDLLRILVDLFKNAKNDAIITAGDFSLTNDKSGVASLLSSVASQDHKTLREFALRNLTAVKDACPNWQTEIPNCEKLISSLWLRSLSIGNDAGATVEDLQLDMTGKEKINDNNFSRELSVIEENSFNLHKQAGKILFKLEENPIAKLHSFARNNTLFAKGEDFQELQKQIKYCLEDKYSLANDVFVLPPDWETNPFDSAVLSDVKQSYLVLPEIAKEEQLGKFLVHQISTLRNTIRFIMPSKLCNNFYMNTDLMQLVRCVYLAKEWSKDHKDYHKEYESLKKDLQEKIKGFFDRYAILHNWNYDKPEQCTFAQEQCKTQGDKLIDEIDRLVLQNQFIPESFEEYVLNYINNERTPSLINLLKGLREPQVKKDCIAWIGRKNIITQLANIIGEGKIAVVLPDGTLLQRKPAEQSYLTKRNAEQKLNSLHESQYKDTFLQKPQTVSDTGEQTTTTTTTTTKLPDDVTPPSPPPPPPPTPNPTPKQLKHYATNDSTSGLNLLGRIEQWGISKTTPSVSNVKLTITQMSGKNLDLLLHVLPSGVKYELELDTEE
ncbi:MAG: DUF499 domain-containing protein [Planctomycetaceae bacterium]|jgi:hypothetical protein|nr:DUF499 domain-containing protein [Planctomycetaceae bacterium]